MLLHNTLFLFQAHLFHMNLQLGELGWRSGESARLPPMCPGFDSRTWRHMWVEFVVRSRPSSEGFSPDSPVFLPPQKSAFLNSNSIGNSGATGLSVEDCYVLPSLNKVKQSQFIINRKHDLPFVLDFTQDPPHR